MIIEAVVLVLVYIKATQNWSPFINTSYQNKMLRMIFARQKTRFAHSDAYHLFCTAIYLKHPQDATGFFFASAYEELRFPDFSLFYRYFLFPLQFLHCRIWSPFQSLICCLAETWYISHLQQHSSEFPVRRCISGSMAGSSRLHCACQPKIQTTHSSICWILFSQFTEQLEIHGLDHVSAVNI